MIKEEAFKILKCEHLEEVQDAYEDALFDYKSKFLQKIPPLKLIDAIKKKINRINAAYNLFFPGVRISDIAIQDNLGDSLSTFLDNHQHSLSKIRLSITNTNNGEELLQWIDVLSVHQTNLFKKMSSYISGTKIDVEAYPIKLSEEIDIFKLQLELKALQLDHTKISEYIRTQINELDFEEFAYITQVVINAEKQMLFNELRIRR